MSFVFNPYDEDVDANQLKIYRAEEEVAYLSPRMTLGEIQSFLTNVVRSRWFEKRYNVHAVVVHDGRGRKQGVGWSENGVCHVSLPRFARNAAYALHELSHGLTYDMHGPEFCQAFLALTGKFIGRDYAKALRRAYEEHDVCFRRRRATLAEELGGVWSAFESYHR